MENSQKTRVELTFEKTRRNFGEFPGNLVPAMERSEPVRFRGVHVNFRDILSRKKFCERLQVSAGARKVQRSSSVKNMNRGICAVI